MLLEAPSSEAKISEKSVAVKPKASALSGWTLSTRVVRSLDVPLLNTKEDE